MHHAATENNDIFDLKRIYISNNSGFTWNFLGQVRDTGSTWQTIEYDITEYQNSSSVQIRFSFEADITNNGYLGWLLDDIHIFSTEKDLPIPEEFILDMYTNPSESRGFVGEEASWNLQIFSTFQTAQEVNASFMIEDPSQTQNITLWNASFISIDSFSGWSSLSINKIFDTEGLYIVFFIVTDENGTLWNEVNNWFTYPIRSFDLNLPLEGTVWMGEMKSLSFQFVANNSEYLDITYSIILQKPNQSFSELREEDFLVNESRIVAPDETVEEIVDVTFTMNGSYVIYFMLYCNDFHVLSPNTFWLDSTTYNVSEDTRPYIFDLSIIRNKTSIYVGESQTTVFRVNFTTYEFFLPNMPQISIEIRIQTPGDVIQSLFLEENFTFPLNGLWIKTLEMDFLLEGIYSVEFEIYSLEGKFLPKMISFEWTVMSHGNERTTTKTTSICPSIEPTPNSTPILEFYLVLFGLLSLTLWSKWRYTAER